MLAAHLLRRPVAVQPGQHDLDLLLCRPTPVLALLGSTPSLSFENEVIRRHTELDVTTSANGKMLIDRDAFNVFLDSDSGAWVITGSFTPVIG